MRNFNSVVNWMGAAVGFLTVYFLAKWTDVDLEYMIQGVTLMLVLVLFLGQNDKQEG